MRVAVVVDAVVDVDVITVVDVQGSGPVYAASQQAGIVISESFTASRAFSGPRRFRTSSVVLINTFTAPDFTLPTICMSAHLAAVDHPVDVVLQP